jgi:hypothetical protein
MVNFVSMVKEHNSQSTVVFKTFTPLEDPLHTYLTGVAAKASSGSRAFQNILYNLKIIGI